MTGLAVTLAFVAGLFLLAALLWGVALLITEVAHRLRGDVRCGPMCGCRGTTTGRSRP